MHLRPEEILQLYDLEMRLDPPDWRASVYRQPGLVYLTAPPPSPHGGWVLFTRLEDSQADDRIDAIIRFFADAGGEFEWKVYDHDQPANLKQRLLGRGFVAEEIEALLVLDLEAAPASFAQLSSPRVRKLEDPAELGRITQIQQEVWGERFDGLVDMLTAEMQASPEAISVFLAEVDGQPASAAWIRYYARRQFAELYGGATIARYRGRGLYTALIQARAREALERGVRFLTVDASPMSRPILEKRGFVFLTHSQPFVYRPQ